MKKPTLIMSCFILSLIRCKVDSIFAFVNFGSHRSLFKSLLLLAGLGFGFGSYGTATDTSSTVDNTLDVVATHCLPQVIGCNLIQNGGFENFIPGTDNLDEFLDNRVCYWTAVGNPNVGSNGANGGLVYAKMWATFGFGEAVLQYAGVDVNKTYELTFMARKDPVSGNDINNLIVGLAHSSNSGMPSQLQVLPTPNPTQIVVNQSSITSTAWVEYKVCFVVNGNYDQLYFHASQAIANGQCWLNIDDVSLNLMEVDAGPDFTVCQGTSVTLGPVTIPFCMDGGSIWSVVSGDFTTPIINATSETPTVAPTTTTTYQLTTSTLSSCSATDFVTVVVESPLTISADGPPSTCPNIGSQFTANIITGYAINPAYSWDFGTDATPQFANVGQVTTEFSTPGFHTVTVSVTNSCGTYTDQSTIEVLTPATGSPINPNQIICVGDNAVLSAIGSPFLTYRWGHYTPNSTWVVDGYGQALTVYPTETTVYILSVTDPSNGCTANVSDVITVTVITAPTISSTQYICVGECATLSVNPTEGVAADYSYLWSHVDVIGGIPIPFIDGTTQSVSVCPQATSSNHTYFATVTHNSLGCEFDVSVELIFSEPTVEISNNGEQILCTGYELEATATNGVPPFNYIWSTGGSSNKTVIRPASNGLQYNVTVTDAEGCTAVDTYTETNQYDMDIPLDNPTPTFYFPNSFTPNGDGLNDVYVIFEDGPAAGALRAYRSFEYELRIWNRWGDEICNIVETENSASGLYNGQIRWDGVACDNVNYSWWQRVVLGMDEADAGSTVQEGIYPWELRLKNCWNSQWIYKAASPYFNSQQVLVYFPSGICPPPGGTPLARIFENTTLTQSKAFSNNDFYVSGDLIIPKGKILTVNNSQVILSNNSRIIIEPGGKLIANGSEFKSCGGVWGGIEVRGASILPHNVAKQGLVQLKKTIIRDARLGVYAGERVGDPVVIKSTGAGGIVNISNNCKFINNGVDIALSHYALNNNKNVIKDTEFGALSGNGFDAPHMYIEGAQGVDIKNNTFEGGLIGVYILEGSKFTIDDNQFSNCKTGLKMESSNDFVVSNNVFADGLIGVLMESCSSFELSDNEFMHVERPVVSKNSKPGSGSTMQGNKMHEPRIGFDFKDDDHSKLDIICNEFIDFKEFAIKSDNTVLKDQGKVNEGAGNLFVSKSSLQYHCLNHNGSLTKYHYDPKDQSGFLNPNIMSPTIDKKKANKDKNCMATGAKLNPYFTADTDAIETDAIETDEVTREEEGNGVVGYSLYNKPNPFEGTTTINYSFISKHGMTEAKLRVYDMFGKEVRDFKLSEPQGELVINLDDYTPGVYVYQLTLGDNLIDAKRMVLIK